MRWLEVVLLLTLLVLLAISTVLDTQESTVNRRRQRRLGIASAVLLTLTGIAMVRRLINLL